MIESGIRENDDDNDVLFDPTDVRDVSTFDLIQSSHPLFLPWSICATMYIICRRGFSRRRNRSRRECYGLVEATPAVSTGGDPSCGIEDEGQEDCYTGWKTFTAH